MYLGNAGMRKSSRTEEAHIRMSGPDARRQILLIGGFQENLQLRKLAGHGWMHRLTEPEDII